MGKSDVIIKVENRGRRVSISKGSESIWLDVDYDKGTVHISATDRSGGYSIASLKFEENQVVKVD